MGALLITFVVGDCDEENAVARCSNQRSETCAIFQLRTMCHSFRSWRSERAEKRNLRYFGAPESDDRRLFCELTPVYVCVILQIK